MERNYVHNFRLLIVGLFLLSGCGQTKPQLMTPSPQASVLPAQTVVPLPEYRYDEQTVALLKTELQNDQEINADVCGLLVFQSGLIHAPVLQGNDNDGYLYHDWQTGNASTRGSIMLDFRNHADFQDDNSIIYGHYVYHRASLDRTLVFTPLEQLLHAENYTANQYLAIITETAVHYYQIKLVYACRLVYDQGAQVAPEELPFNDLSYSEMEFDNYIQAAKAVQYYDTGEAVVYGKRLLTLQTCVEFEPDIREIVLCQEVETVTFP